MTAPHTAAIAANASLQTVYPSLAYEDAERAIDWLRRAFGFELALSVPGKGGGVLHGELHTPDGGTIMVLSTQHSTRRNRSPRSLGGTAASVYVATRDPDSLHDRVARARADVFNPLRDTDHGREFCCLDPEGHIWTFGTYAPEQGVSRAHDAQSD